MAFGHGHVRRPVRFAVIVEGRDARRMPTRRTHSQHVAEGPAIYAVADIMRQWSTEPWSIPPGTKVSVVDRNDGGAVFVAEYRGYEPNLLTGSDGK